MIEKLKNTHFNINPNLVDRSAKDLQITPSLLARRAMAFEMLGDLSTRIQSPKLVSSSVGSIDSLLLTIPGWVFTDPPASRDAYKDAYTDLLRKLPAATKFIILTNQSAEQSCKSWIESLEMDDRATIVIAPDELKFSIWAEDAYCMAVDQATSETFFIESVAFDRYDDEYVADEVSNATNLKLSLADVYFQGGNVLIGDDYWLLGMDYPAKSFEYGFITQGPSESKLDATRRVYGKLMDKHRVLFPIGTHLAVPQEAKIPQQIEGETWHHHVFRGNGSGTSQPLFHIDMFITLLGRKSGKPLVMVGDPSMATKTLGDLDFVKFAEQFSMQSVFDNIADRLSQLDFTVIRNPLPPAYFVDHANKEIKWYFATPNNALVQVLNNEKQIWLPQYGFGAFAELAATDKQTKDILENEGFTVHALSDFHPFAAGLGAVHCITKYIGRS